MPLLIQRLLRAALPALDASRAPLRNDRPERIVLGVRPGYRPSSKPPVRIFLGSERAQFRAERVFLWSVEKHRDPSRIYEIHLLKELKGFNRRLWLTGFTNYRFAIPLFCGFAGRAIYNDTDQVYLRDPAELFDQEMQGAGFLSISDRDTSVMLIDCAAMAGVWDEASVRNRNRKQLEARARSEKLWGPMDPGWNARDGEYDPEGSHLVHFTTLHTQPWRPFPDQFVYFPNEAVGELWHRLEAEADDEGFLPVSAARPSAHWPAALPVLQSKADPALLALLQPDPVSEESRDERVVRGVLEHVPDADLPWVLDRLLGASRRIKLIVAEPTGRATEQWFRRNRHFWLQLLEQASRRHPSTHWQLHLRRGRRQVRFAGGKAPAGDIVVLTHRKPGHDHQALAVAESVARHSGRRLVRLPLACSEAGWFASPRVRRREARRLPDDAAVIVASGWLSTRVARRMAAQAQRDLRLVLMGRKAGPVPDHGAVVVNCGHYNMTAHPARIETLLPLNAGYMSPTTEPSSWQIWRDSPRRVALLVGGNSRSHRLSVEEAERLARSCSSWAAARQARLLVVTSRRTGARALKALQDGLGADDLLYRWRADEGGANPYGLALREADALVVTGESEAMLADAVTSGKPTYIWPLPGTRSGLWHRISAWMDGRARRPSYNRRGSIRPQQGLGYLCARAVERQWVLPPRRPEHLHDALVSQGVADPFGTAEERPLAPYRGELEPVTVELLRRLRLDGAAGVDDVPHEKETLNVSSG